MFITMLEETKEVILDYCDIEDVKNLSLTSREYNETLQGYLFHCVRIPDLSRLYSLFSQEEVFDRIKRLKKTVVLRAYVPHFSDKRMGFLKAISELKQLRQLQLMTASTTPLQDADIHILCDNLHNLRVLGLQRCDIMFVFVEVDPVGMVEREQLF